VREERTAVAVHDADKVRVVDADEIGFLVREHLLVGRHHAGLELVDRAGLDVDKVRRVAGVVPDLDDLAGLELLEVHVIAERAVARTDRGGLVLEDDLVAVRE
jgi:hypothetical protein